MIPIMQKYPFNHPTAKEQTELEIWAMRMQQNQQREMFCPTCTWRGRFAGNPAECPKCDGELEQLPF